MRSSGRTHVTSNGLPDSSLQAKHSATHKHTWMKVP